MNENKNEKGDKGIVATSRPNAVVLPGDSSDSLTFS